MQLHHSKGEEEMILDMLQLLYNKQNKNYC